MNNLHIALNSRFQYAPTSFLMRFGRRELFICRDFRSRYYSVNPLLEFGAGVEAGHLEILVLRRWLIILSRAR